MSWKCPGSIQCSHVHLAMRLRSPQDIEFNIRMGEFIQFIDTIQMRELLSTLDLELSEVKAIFELLDVDGNQTTNVVEVFQACERFSRPCRSVDCVSMLLGLRGMERDLQSFKEFIGIPPFS